MKGVYDTALETAVLLNIGEIGQRILKQVAGNDIADEIDGQDLGDIATELQYVALDKKISAEAQ